MEGQINLIKIILGEGYICADHGEKAGDGKDPVSKYHKAGSEISVPENQVWAMKEAKIRFKAVEGQELPEPPADKFNLDNGNEEELEQDV